MISSLLYMLLLLSIVRVAAEMFQSLIVEVHKRSRGQRFIVITLSTFAKFYALSLLLMMDHPINKYYSYPTVLAVLASYQVCFL